MYITLSFVHFSDPKTYREQEYYDPENSSRKRVFYGEQHPHWTTSIYKYYFSGYVLKLVQACFYVT